MPLSPAFARSIENGDWLAWSALIAGTALAILAAVAAANIVRKV